MAPASSRSGAWPIRRTRRRWVGTAPGAAHATNVTYEGLVVKVQRLYLAKERESMQPHIRAFVDRAVVFTRVVFTGTPADLIAHGDSLTARHLRTYLKGESAIS